MAVNGPTFIYVGTPKAGSSWLFEAFGEHPDIFVVPAKSSGRYETSIPGNLEEYMEAFSSSNALASGEIAHDAYVTPGVAKRLQQDFPNIKILICLREPGSFARSCLRWWVTHTERFGKSVEAMTAHPHFNKLIDYEAALTPYFETFPRDQFHVFFFEDISTSPELVLSEVFGFLGVDTNFRPKVTNVMVNRARSPRFRLLTRAIYFFGEIGRRIGFTRAVERAKRSTFAERLMYSSEVQTPHNPDLEAAIAEVRMKTQPSFEKLENLIGRSLPKSWRER